MYPGSPGLLLAVEEWGFADAENVNVTFDCKCKGCMWKYMQARSVQEAVTMKELLDNVTTLIATRPHKKLACTARNVFCSFG